MLRAIYARSTLGAPITYWPQGVPCLWSHVGVIEPSDKGLDEPVWVWEARIGRKFGPTAIDKFRQRYTATEVVTYDVPDVNAAVNWLECHRGMPYGFGTVIGIALGLKHGEAYADTCSEALENALSAGGLKRWRGDLHRVTPNQSYHNLAGVA